MLVALTATRRIELGVMTGKAANLDVAVEADVATFLDRLIERVGGLASERSAVAR